MSGKILLNIGKIVAGTAFTLATHGTGNIVLGVLNEMALGILPSLLQDTKFSELKNALIPNKNLETDGLQKISNEAVILAIKSITEQYKGRLQKKEQRSELKQATTNLIKSIKQSKEISWENIDSENSTHSLELFNTEIQKLPIIDTRNPYPAFFKEKFEKTIQLCFDNLLKENESAWKEYKNETDKNLKSNIAKILEQQDFILQGLSSTKKKLIREDLEKISTSNLNYEKAFDEHFEQLHRENKDIYDTVQTILNNQKKTMLASFAIIGLLIFIIGAGAYYIYSLPFQINISIEKNKEVNIHSQYPKLSKEARLRFYFPKNTIEKQVTFSNEILVNDIAKALKGKSIKIELIDEYWQTSQDSLQLENGNVTVPIQPNAKLATVTGTVKDRFGNAITNATVKVEGLTTKTDIDGYYIFTIPIALRKPKYDIRIEKQGFIAGDYEYYAGTAKEIRLSKPY